MLKGCILILEKNSLLKVNVGYANTKPKMLKCAAISQYLIKELFYEDFFSYCEKTYLIMRKLKNNDDRQLLIKTRSPKLYERYEYTIEVLKIDD